MRRQRPELKEYAEFFATLILAVPLVMGFMVASAVEPLFNKDLRHC